MQYLEMKETLKALKDDLAEATCRYERAYDEWCYAPEPGEEEYGPTVIIDGEEWEDLTPILRRPPLRRYPSDCTPAGRGLYEHMVRRHLNKKRGLEQAIAELEEAMTRWTPSGNEYTAPVQTHRLDAPTESTPDSPVEMEQHKPTRDRHNRKQINNDAGVFEKFVDIRWHYERIEIIQADIRNLERKLGSLKRPAKRPVECPVRESPSSRIGSSLVATLASLSAAYAAMEGITVEEYEENAKRDRERKRKEERKDIKDKLASRRADLVKAIEQKDALLSILPNDNGTEQTGAKTAVVQNGETIFKITEQAAKTCGLKKGKTPTGPQRNKVMEFVKQKCPG